MVCLITRGAEIAGNLWYNSTSQYICIANNNNNRSQEPREKSYIRMRNFKSCDSGKLIKLCQLNR